MTTTVDSAPTELVHKSAKRTREIFAADFGAPTALDNSPQPAIAPPIASPAERAQKIALRSRIDKEYADVKELPPVLAAKQASAAASRSSLRKKPKTEEQASNPKMAKMIEGVSAQTSS
ncbi:hypothetical protein KCU96_g22684, partial [Aureobasidium melanogenum]